jgi:hypothetical protein
MEIDINNRKSKSKTPKRSSQHTKITSSNDIFSNLYKKHEEKKQRLQILT